MGKKHFTEERIAFAPRQAESGTSAAEAIRKLGVSEQTFSRCKKRFAVPVGAAAASSHTVSAPDGKESR
jgi:hypothetical protein